VGGGTAALTILPGATTGNTATITVTPANGFTGTVSLTCSVTPIAASDPPTCSLSPPSLSLISAAPQYATLTISTTPASLASRQIQRLLWPSAGSTALALLLMFAVPRRSRNWPVMLFLLVMVISASAIGCGVNGAGSRGVSTPGTSAGTYTVLVTGASGSVTGTVGTITLNIQ